METHAEWDFPKEIKINNKYSLATATKGSGKKVEPQCTENKCSMNMVPKLS